MKHTDIRLEDRSMRELISWYPKEEYRIPAIRGRQARIYINLYLEKDEKLSTSSKCGRCCYEGSNFYRRKDATPIIPEDVEALKDDIHGQVNTITVPTGGLMLRQYWLCDSSD